MKKLKSIPKISNMISPSGNYVSNQFEIQTNEGVFFQSYNTIIAVKLNNGTILLDENKWNYSKTTGKYRNIFLGLNKKETVQAIAKGEIKLTNLN